MHRCVQLSLISSVVHTNLPYPRCGTSVRYQDPHQARFTPTNLPHLRRYRCALSRPTSSAIHTNQPPTPAPLQVCAIKPHVKRRRCGNGNSTSSALPKTPALNARTKLLKSIGLGSAAAARFGSGGAGGKTASGTSMRAHALSPPRHRQAGASPGAGIRTQATAQRLPQRGAHAPCHAAAAATATGHPRGTAVDGQAAGHTPRGAVAGRSPAHAATASNTRPAVRVAAAAGGATAARHDTAAAAAARRGEASAVEAARQHAGASTSASARPSGTTAAARQADASAAVAARRAVAAGGGPAVASRSAAAGRHGNGGSGSAGTHVPSKAMRTAAQQSPARSGGAGMCAGVDALTTGATAAADGAAAGTGATGLPRPQSAALPAKAPGYGSKVRSSTVLV